MSGGPPRPVTNRRRKKRANGDRALIDIVHRAADGVGESLRWIEEDHALLWVDITGQAIKRLEVRTGRYEEWRTPGFRPPLCPVSKSAVVAIGRRVTLFNFGDRFDTLVVPEPNHPENRRKRGGSGSAGAPLGRNHAEQHCARWNP